MTSKIINSAFNDAPKGHLNPRYLKSCAEYFAKNPQATVRIVARRRLGRDWVNMTFYARDGFVFELLGEQIAKLVAGALGCGTPLERLTGIYELVRSQDCRPSPPPATWRYTHG
ncbi:hypothetical protein [Bradyrhizobium guangdongense]|uniref:hypothetical protein n=1 Tax=Bradyrhizobium TaxID=374 RepID=UPI001319D326|nr:hypothetical protein [Bradyrhizobium guangdongense]